MVTQKPWRPKKKDTQVPQSSVPSDNVADEAVYKELDDSLVRAATNASSLEAKQDSVPKELLQVVVPSVKKPWGIQLLNEASSQGTTSGGGPKRQKTMGDTIAQTRFENVSKLSNDPLLAIESSRDEEDLGEDASKQGRRIHDIDADEDITLFNEDNEIFDVLKSAKPKADKVVIQEPEQGTTTTTPTIIIHVPKPLQDKDKGIMIEQRMVEQVKPMKRLEQ
ncbi:hypothetical protein Tco_1526589 [Tanacetum coccineum]